MEHLKTTFERDLKIWQPRVESFLEVKIGEVKVQSQIQNFFANSSLRYDHLSILINRALPNSRYRGLITSLMHYVVMPPVMVASTAHNSFYTLASAHYGNLLLYNSFIAESEKRFNTKVLIHEVSHLANGAFDPLFFDGDLPTYLTEGFADQVASVIFENAGLGEYGFPRGDGVDLRRFRRESRYIKEGSELKRFMLEKSAEARAKLVHP